MYSVGTDRPDGMMFSREEGIQGIQNYIMQDTLNSMNTTSAIDMGAQAVSSACNAISSIYAQVIATRMQKAQYSSQEYITNIHRDIELDNIANEQLILQNVAEISNAKARSAEEAAQARANLEVAQAELAQQRQTRSFGNPVEST